MKSRLVPIAAAAAAVLAFAATGCGGGSDSSGGDPATLVPAQTPFYVEASVRPQGELKTNVDELAKSIAGVDDLGGLIVSELESSSDSSEDIDFEKEVEPWLGEKGGVGLEKYDGDDFSGYAIAVQSTDTDATRAFVDKTEKADGAKEGSYEGVDYWIDADDSSIVGVVGDFLAGAEDEQTFKAMVDASNGESLADSEDFAETFDAAPSGSLADIYVDIGTLIEEAGGTIDPDAQQFLDSAGIDAKEATAVASLIPGSDQIEIDVSSDLGGENPPSGDASELLGSLPGDSVAAFASADFGERFKEAIDELDAKGIPGEVPPHKFKSGLKEAGIDVETIGASLGDLGLFATGSTESSLGGAAVLTTKGSSEASNTVANIGLFLRAAGVSGVTAISGKASGFSIRSEDLGPKPLVIAAKGEKIAIAYGLPAATEALGAGSGQTLADDPTYKEGVSALGGTPISGFVAGKAALKLASALIPADEKEGFLEAKRYLTKIDYLAIGAGSSGELATAKLIAGIGK